MLLGGFIEDRFGIDGLQSWQGTVGPEPTNRLPWVGVNATGSDQAPFGVDWPAGALLVHPDWRQPVFLAWRAPVSGSFGVWVRLWDAHDLCGNGFDWSLHQSSNMLASGRVPNGGSVMVGPGASDALAAVRLERGMALRLRIASGPAHDASCDSTRVTFIIRRG